MTVHEDCHHAIICGLHVAFFFSPRPICSPKNNICEETLFFQHVEIPAIAVKLQI
jgi:hypothetical protein